MPTAAVAFIIALASACTAQVPIRATDARASAILGGAPDAADEHTAVVALTIDTGADRFGCTGSAVAPGLVLTAAHCLEGAVGVEVGFGITRDDAEWHDATSFVSHPDFDAASYAHDVAFVWIADQPDGVVPVRLADRAPVVALGDEIELVGYGRTEVDEGGRRLHASLTVAFVCDDDQPCAFYYSPFGYTMVPPGGFCHDRSDAGTCKGDSGGPAFAVVDGEPIEVGVSSFGDADCVSYGCHAPTLGSDPFIAEQLAAADADADADAGVGDADAGTGDDLGPQADAGVVTGDDAGPVVEPARDAGAERADAGTAHDDVRPRGSRGGCAAAGLVTVGGKQVTWPVLPALVLVAARTARRSRRTGRILSRGPAAGPPAGDRGRRACRSERRAPAGDRTGR